MLFASCAHKKEFFGFKNIYGIFFQRLFLFVVILFQRKWKKCLQNLIDRMTTVFGLGKLLGCSCAWCTAPKPRMTIKDKITKFVFRIFLFIRSNNGLYSSKQYASCRSFHSLRSSRIVHITCILRLTSHPCLSVHFLRFSGFIPNIFICFWFYTFICRYILSFRHCCLLSFHRTNAIY